MSKNQLAIDYINAQLSGFKPEFVKCVIRCFEFIDEIHQPDGCLSNSIALFICAKYYGYEPNLCYGLCSFEGQPFYHAWLEIDDIIIDLSIYGNVNYNPIARLIWKKQLSTPYIGQYDNAIVKYGRFEFDTDWQITAIAQLEGCSFEQYMDGAPNGDMWKLVCQFLNEKPTQEVVKHLRSLIKKYSIFPD